MTAKPNKIYKILTSEQWKSLQSAGFFEGAPIDLEDGYIHFSTAAQLKETVSKHFKNQSDLILVSVNTDRLGDELKYEPSRGCDLFPHLYSKLDQSAIIAATVLQEDGTGGHIIPENLYA